MDTFRLVINGQIARTKEINILNYQTSQKDVILSAIQYILFSDKPLDHPNKNKFITMEKCKQIYTKGIIKSIETNILNIETEQKRDNLEKYNLIFIEKNENCNN